MPNGELDLTNTAIVKKQIMNIYHENRGRYGYRRIKLELRNRGCVINHKTVQRLMKYIKLFCRVRMKKYHAYKGEVGKIAPNLLGSDFEAKAPNEKWVTDITEFNRLAKTILSTILDLYSRNVISYSISDRPPIVYDCENVASGI